MPAGDDTTILELKQNILPLFTVEQAPPGQPLEFQGTGFVIGRNVLVTCWHCVSSTLRDDQAYAALTKRQNGQHQVHFLSQIQQDTHSRDLATASINLEPTQGTALREGDAPWGTDVWTFGYPLTHCRARQDGGLQFVLNTRLLRGYITRTFLYNESGGAGVPSYELDMPAPEGLSGSPLFEDGSNNVIGVVYGVNKVGTIEEFSSVDEETGHRTPEIEKVTSFALAHNTASLRALTGDATMGLSLADYLARGGR